MLPRQTREHKLHVADTVNYNTGRMNWKFGGDFMQGWIYNYYPSMFGGEYYFSNVKVNPWFFTPAKYGEPLTPLRAYAHEVPRYYMQDFGNCGLASQLALVCVLCAERHSRHPQSDGQCRVAL